jgi:hypothetical protein
LNEAFVHAQSETAGAICAAQTQAADGSRADDRRLAIGAEAGRAHQLGCSIRSRGVAADGMAGVERFSKTARNYDSNKSPTLDPTVDACKQLAWVRFLLTG